MPNWGRSPDDQIDPPLERTRELMRGKSQAEYDLQTRRRKPMTIAELHKAVRALVPYECTTHVEVGVWHYTHHAPSDNPAVNVAIYADYRGSRESVEAATADEALTLFRIQALPKLGLAEVAPAMERLAAMDADELLLTT